jgi:hypothetical protein
MVPFPAGFLDGIAWLGDGRIVFGYKEPQDGLGAETHLWSVRPDGSGAGPVEIDTGAKCTRSETLAPLALADGRLSYQLRCAPGSRGPFSEKTSLLAVDASGHSIPLMPLIDLAFIPRQAAFAPDNSEGLLGGGSAICEGIVRVDHTGTRPLRLSVTDGGRSFDLGEFEPTSDCEATGNADLPAWSRDGRSIAFFASTAAIGASGPSRLDAPWALFTGAADMTNARAIILGVEDPAGLAWSPDSRWLAFASQDGDRQGLWVVESGTGRLVRISSGSGWLDVAWSPTGTQLATLRDEAPLGEDRTQIVLFDIAAATSLSP